jgi:hypothetical protein
MNMLRPILGALAYAFGIAALSPAPSAAQDTTRMHQPGVKPDSNRIGVMSPLVMEQRLKMLGYTDIVVVEAQQGAVLANPYKAGRALAVKLDPYTGKVVELKGRLERRRQGVRLVKPGGEVVAPPR